MSNCRHRRRWKNKFFVLIQYSLDCCIAENIFHHNRLADDNAMQNNLCMQMDNSIVTTVFIVEIETVDKLIPIFIINSFSLLTLLANSTTLQATTKPRERICCVFFCLSDSSSCISNALKNIVFHEQGKPICRHHFIPYIIPTISLNATNGHNEWNFQRARQATMSLASMVFNNVRYVSRVGHYKKAQPNPYYLTHIGRVHATF